MLLTPVTKLAPPQLHRDVIARPHVLARLAEALHVPLTVLVAPAGFGKTTLLASWAQYLAAADPPVQTIWLSLDPGDSDPTIFCELLIHALQRLQPALGADTLAALRAPQPPPLELALIPLINDLALLPGALALILDDYQHCDTPQLNHALSFLIEHVPPTVHFVLAARSEPQFPLARWRARRRLLELRSAELRFSPAEASALLAEIAGRALDPAAVMLLEQRTEGWAAGLQLAGLALRERLEHSAPLDAATLGERYSLDFLAGEVLDQLPEQLRSFLLATSILERLCAELCAAVLDSREPARADTAEQPILEDLERRGLFLTPLDAQRTWFRYHQLFAQLLRERLRRSVDPATVAALHRRAAAWLAAHQEPGAAINHWLAADDVDGAVALIETNALPLLFRGQGRTVRDWLARLPSELAAQRPALALISAWTALFTSEMAAAQQYCAAAARALERDPSALPELHAGLAALRSVLTSFVEQYSQATDAGRLAVTQLPADSPLQSMVRAGLAFASLLDGRFDDAEDLALAELAGLPVDPAVALLRIHYQTLLAISRRMRGRLNEALTYSAQATTLLSSVRAGAPLPSSIPALTEHAVNRYEAGDCVAAAALLDEVFALYNLGRIERLTIPPAWLQARLRAAEGAYVEAQALLSTALATARRLDLRQSLAFTAGEMVAMALRCGDLPLAYRAAAIVEACAIAPNGLLPSTEVYLVPARMALAEGRPAEALLLLTALYEQAVANNRGLLALKALILSALAYAAQGDLPAALGALGRAVQLAAPAGFVRAFVDEGASLSSLLQAYQAPHIAERAFLTRVLDAFPALVTADPDPLAEPLTDRELTILRLLAAGYSNQAIAAELIIALGTVKRHVANLAAKLGTTSRLATVARARELGIV
jgi:LuxR family maltose regulon positive regulatory protein